VRHLTDLQTSPMTSNLFWFQFFIPVSATVVKNC